MHNKIQVSNGKKLIIIYKRPDSVITSKSAKYYFRYVSGYYTNYYVGMKNQYDHEIILIIEVTSVSNKLPFRSRLIRKFISFLEKLERRIS